jgi:hypothetical protein
MMSILGKRCKEFPLSQLRQFSGWTEQSHNARKIRVEVNGQTEEVVRKLTDDDYLYLQENLTVTDGIFLDEHIIFANDTPEWREFCKNVLEWKPLGEGPSSSDE